MTGNTPPKYPKGTPRKHHYIPRGYLARFCGSNEERLALFDRVRNSYRDRQRILDVAHIKDYYAFEVDGDLNFDVERALGDIESGALPVIAKIDARQPIDGDERYALALYTAFQHTRTPAFQNTSDEMSSILTRQLVAMAPEPVDGESMTEEQIAAMLGLEMGRRATLRLMLSISPQIAELLYEMDWVIARRPDDKSSFITTDSPFCLIPGPDHVPQPFRGIGISTPGILKTIPLSQSSALLITEPGQGMVDLTLTRDQVRGTNIAVAAQCKNLVFGRDMRVVERTVKESQVDKTQWQVPVSSN